MNTMEQAINKGLEALFGLQIAILESRAKGKAIRAEFEAICNKKEK